MLPGKRLGLDHVAEEGEDGLDEVVFELGLAVLRDEMLLLLLEGGWFVAEVVQVLNLPERGHLREHILQVVVGEEPFIARRREAKLDLGDIDRPPPAGSGRGRFGGERRESASAGRHVGAPPASSRRPPV
ncbi:MAG: hypothetical protein HPY44_21810 [Armatimonadetes bacterium]|nr:hypothetical protein [Armatimonadota bacterium]